MSAQSQLFPEPPASPQSELEAAKTPPRLAPVWLQRLSLGILVVFCVYLGALVTALPWWPRVWDENLFFIARPRLNAFLHLGAVRGAISGIGLLDIWFGLSEAVHYREDRRGR